MQDAARIPPQLPAINAYLPAADHRVALYFDLGVRIGQGRDRNERTAWEIVPEYLPADLREAITIANVGDEHGHLHHVAQLAAGLLQRAIEILEELPDLAVKIAGKRLAGIIDRCCLPGEPHRPAAFGDDSHGIAALLRTVALDEIPG